MDAQPMHLITIDTEFSSHPGELGLTGRVDGEEVGALRLGQLCRAQGIRATFFMDVFIRDAARCELMRTTGRQLLALGHDLELHTHPDGLYDARRGYLALYSFEEQVAMLREGRRRFIEWFGVEPVAHRAGDWGANRDTVRALGVVGIPVDSSWYVGWPTCRLAQFGTRTNRPQVLDGILEVPPTVFFNNSLGLGQAYRLVSTDGQPYGEVEHVLRRLNDSDAGLVMSVFHSFSLLEWNASRTRYWVARQELDKFERFLAHLSRAGGARCLTLRELYAEYQREPSTVLARADGIPSSSLRFLLPRAFDRARLMVRSGWG